MFQAELISSEIKAIEHASTLTLEQPLNESLRLFLHLEQLFDAFKKHVELKTRSSIFEAINYLIKILFTIERPDLKTKLTHSLSQITTSLAQLQSFPQVNSTKLTKLLQELDYSIRYLLSCPGKIGDSLKENEILNLIKIHAVHTNGIFKDKVPILDLWLNQPVEKTTSQINSWASELILINKVISQILSITRMSSSFQTIEFSNGFFQQSLPLSPSCDLVRLKINCENQIFPEFSVGKHRLAIKLMQITEFHLKPQPCNLNLKATISLCRV